MQPQELDDIKVALEERHAKMLAKANALRCELTSLENELARIDAALAALAGTTQPTLTAKHGKKETRKSAAPSATKALVTDLILQVLSTNSVIQVQDLKSLVERKLIERGHNRNGYAMRFKEALTDPRLRMSDEVVSLTRNSPMSEASSTRPINNRGQDRQRTNSITHNAPSVSSTASLTS